jgi:hypothetical protein
MKRLFKIDKQPRNAPLFNSCPGMPFSRYYVLRKLNNRLIAAGIVSSGYSEHSFRYGAT